jgi:predicted dehydrogenase
MKSKKNDRSMSRRELLGAAAASAAAAAAVTIVPRCVLGGPNFVAPSERVNVGLIGAGGQGRTNIRALFGEADCQVIAVADPAEKVSLERFYYRGAGGRGPVSDEIEKKYNKKPAQYEDFRQMLDKEKSLDAVLIATPDHNHAMCAITAMRQGKHVYCEKPLAHSIYEVRLMAKVAKETGVATQMGNHGHSGEGLRATAEWIWDGAIGKIREVNAFSSAGRFASTKGMPPAEPVPAGVNWDLWIGTRPMRPFYHDYLPFNWRGWWTFGSAALGDMACHNMDPAVFALKLERPISVESTARDVDPEVTQAGAITTWEFGPRGDMPPVTMRWYDGPSAGKVPTPPGVDAKDPKQHLGEGGNGIVFVGEKGVITCAGWAGMPRILPLSLNKEYKRPEKTLPRVKGHHADWLSACKGGKPASGNFDYSAKLTEVVLLGNVAVRSGQKIEWDYDNMKVSNVAEANRFLKDEYRPGWEVA